MSVDMNTSWIRSTKSTTIRARFTSVCRVCGKRIKAGTECRWTKNKGVVHLECRRGGA